MKSGYYLDDGSTVDPDKIKLPKLCKDCSKNGDPNEEVPCNLNRLDQQKEISSGKEFKCFAYKKSE